MQIPSTHAHTAIRTQEQQPDLLTMLRDTHRRVLLGSLNQINGEG